ncbi:MAG: DUF3987 domain-containing protein [Armatimonadetes bacterium]|nr:DUF3987 domain-containing protein [Armatimonadota bacterium]
MSFAQTQAPFREVTEHAARCTVPDFEALGVEFPQTRTPSVNVRCPVPGHEDKSPSCVVTISGPGAGLWHCKACQVGDNIIGLKCLIDGHVRDDRQARADAARALAELLHVEVNHRPRRPTPPPRPVETPSPEPIPETVVNTHHRALLADRDRMRRLIDEACLSEAVIRTVGIGWLPGERRYTIPVRHWQTGEVVDLRKWQAPSDRPKRKDGKRVAKGLPWTEGRGTNLLGFDLVGGCDWFLYCEGEVDALALVSIGVPAVSASPGGSCSWPKDDPPDLTGKVVYILGDNDAEGRRHREIAPKLYEAGAALVYVCDWPADAPEGDDPRALLTRLRTTHVREHSYILAVEAVEALRLGANLVTPPVGKEEALIAAAMPADGWLGEWLKYARAFNEACDAFLLAAGLVCLAQATGRKAWLIDGDRNLYPNLFALLVGGQALARKSTTLGLIRRRVNRAFDKEAAPDDWTPEALLDSLAEQPCALWLVDEFSSVAEGSRRDYRAGTRQLLAGLFDSPDSYSMSRRDKDREAKVEAVFLNIGAATTLSWFRSALTDGDLGGGLLSRFAFFLAGDSGRVFPRRPQHDEKASNELTRGLHELRQALGDGRRLDDGPIGEAYGAFYHRVRAWAGDDGDEDATLGGFYARIAEMALKFAVLYQLAEDPRSTTVGLSAWRHAEALATYLRQTARAVVGDVGEPKEDRAKRRIAEVIREGEGAWVTLKVISGKVGAKLANADTRRKLLLELCREGCVQSGHKGQAEAYKWTDNEVGGVGNGW